jgi:hypothetical protein
MKNVLYYLAGEIALSFIGALLSNVRLDRDFLTIFGLMNLIISIVGLISGVIFQIAKTERIAKPLLISSAFLLLLGFLTCSVFPLRLNGE